MNLQPVAAIVLRQFYLIRGSFSRVFPLFAWVAIDIVLWGFMSRYLNGLALDKFNFISAILGAVLLWDFCIRVMQGVTMAFFEDVWSRNFLNFFASPLRVIEYLLGLVVSSIITSFFGLVVMIIVAVAVFGLSFLFYGVLILPALMILFLFGIALGVIGCAAVLKFGPSAEWFIWPIPAVISPFVGVFYPLSVLPDWMRYISGILPPAYVFESIRAITNNQPLNWVGLIWAAGLALFYLALSCRFFVKVYAQALNAGIIVRYSAETVS